MAVTPRLMTCIIGCSIDPLDAGLPADHRSMTVDFDTYKVFQGEIAAIRPSHERMLQSASIKVATKYRTILCKQLERCRVFQRITELHTWAKNLPDHGFTNRMHKEAERLDVTIGKAMLYAERKSCTHHYQDAWSPQLIHSMLTLKFWRVVISGILNGRDVSPIIQPIVSRVPGLRMEHRELSIDAAKEEFKKALIKAHDSKKRSIELRDQHLLEQATVKAIQGNISEETAIRALREHEKKKIAYAQLRKIMKPRSATSGLSAIMIPALNEDGETIGWKTIVDATEIETKLLERNRAHYGQASETPFASSPLSDLVGHSGTTDYATSVIEGTCALDEYPEETQAIFTELRRDEAIPLIPSEINFDDFVNALKKWPERTSTSPSGRHLGHYKSLLLPIPADTDESGQKLLRMHHEMLQIAQLRRRPYKRWLKEVEVMLEKEEGNPKIHRLRIICLYEADYNIFLKTLWAYRLVRHAESYNMLGEAQGGSRPNRATPDISVRKWQTYFYSRISRTSLGALDNDAQACFDRIVASLALMASRHYGMPADACELHGTTIEEMEHYVKTAVGISQRYFRSTPDQKLFGSGQGSGGSPPLWLVVVTVLFRALVRLRGEGMHFTNPSGTIREASWD